MKTVEFFCFMWIFIRLFNICVHSSEFESEDEPNLGPVFTVINKCDPDSFNSKEGVEQFTKAFGYVGKIWALNFTFTSSLNRSKSRCKMQTVEIQLKSTSKSTSQTATLSIAENENEIIRAQPEFFDHGFFSYEPDFYINPKNYCVKKESAFVWLLENRMSRDILTVEICEPASNSTSESKSTGSDFPPTLQKCCSIGDLLTFDENQNVTCDFSYEPPWKPGNFMENMEIYPNYEESRPCISVIYILPHQLAPQIKREENSPIIYKDVRVLENGGVETRDTGNHKRKKLEENTYCIDGFHAQLTGNKSAEEIPADRFMVLQCASKISESSEIKDIIYIVACFISSFVLLLIVIAYVLIWKQQNIHGWTSAAFSFSMFLWLFCTGVRLVYKQDGEEDGFCVFIAITSHFFRISVYSWMLLLNLDLWSTMCSMLAPCPRSKGRTRFLCYCCFALTIPMIVVSISLIIETQFSLFEDRVIRPQYGRERCYLALTAVKAYAIIPSLILFLPNFIFILLTLKKMLDSKNERRRLNRGNSRVHAPQRNNKTETKLCFKIFIIIGISWIFEIISGLLDTDEVSWYWMITDIYNIAQSFPLFWLFVCQKTTRDQLSKKYSLFKAGFRQMETPLQPGFSTTRTTTFSGSGRSESHTKPNQISKI